MGLLAFAYGLGGGGGSGSMFPPRGAHRSRARLGFRLHDLHRHGREVGRPLQRALQRQQLARVVAPARFDIAVAIDELAGLAGEPADLELAEDMARPAPVGDVQAGLGGFRIHLGAAVDNARRRIVDLEQAAQQQLFGVVPVLVAKGLAATQGPGLDQGLAALGRDVALYLDAHLGDQGARAGRDGDAHPPGLGPHRDVGREIAFRGEQFRHAALRGAGEGIEGGARGAGAGRLQMAPDEGVERRRRSDTHLGDGRRCERPSRDCQQTAEVPPDREHAHGCKVDTRCPRRVSIPSRSRGSPGRNGTSGAP